MNKTTTIILVIVMASVVYFSAGCKKDNVIEKVEYQMQVDSIQHADTITVGEVFEVYFFGPIGPNSCYSFSHFVPSFGLQSMYFSLYGVEEKRNDCIDGGKYMNGQGAGLQDMTAGEWSITVFQPAGVDTIRSTVYVRE